MSEASENYRPRVMYWTRKFGEPLRKTFKVDMEDNSDEFIALLAQADSRLRPANQSKGG